MRAQIIGTLKLHQPWTYEAQYGNSGREPALGFSAQEDFGTVDIPKAGQTWYDVFPESKLGDVCDRAHAKIGEQTVYPSSLREYRYDVTTDKVDITNEILKGTEAFFVHGCFAYQTFGKEHKSEYCFVFVRGADPKTHKALYTAQFCVRGNHAT